MDFGAGTFALGYLAGVLSTLSPCVLPLLPILVVSALAQSRFGLVALAGGLTLSFAAVGLFIGTLGAAVGLDSGVLRQGAAVLLMLFGLMLWLPRWQQALTRATSRVGAAGDGLMARIAGVGWAGQFAVGLVLGVVWSPCVGPTLGAATTLAAQGSHLTQIALLMLLFGLGAATPLMLVGSLSRDTMLRLRGRLLAAGQAGKFVLGAMLLIVGMGILTGWDKQLEGWVVERSPEWLTNLTTRY